MLRTDIGDGVDALQCTTDRAGCCRGSDGERAGEFYFPDGTQVPILGDNPSIRTYYRTRDHGLIRLNRRDNGMETGQFRCEIPDASGTTVNLFIIIGNYIAKRVVTYNMRTLFFATVDQPPPTTSPFPLATTTPPPSNTQIDISLSASGTNTTGQTYRLVCSATVTGSTEQPTFTWLDPINNLVPSGMITTTDSMSTLTFSPLTVSHAGTYTCRVTVGGVTETQTTTVIVNGTDDLNYQPRSLILILYFSLLTHAVISAKVTSSGSGGSLSVGQTDFSLTCQVSGTENLNSPTFTYQWWKNSRVVAGQQGDTLSLPLLTLSDAGEYTCSVSVSSSSWGSTVTVNSTNTETVVVRSDYLLIRICV